MSDMAHLILYLAVSNFVVAVGYYLIIVVIWALPIAVPWMRRLGKPGIIFACFLTSFFFGCGSHHLDVSTFFWTSVNPAAGGHAALTSLVVWETMQIVGAFGAVVMLLVRGNYFIEQLKHPLRDVQP